MDALAQVTTWLTGREVVKLESIRVEIVRVEDRDKSPVFDVHLTVTIDGYSIGVHHEVDNVADALDLVNDRIVDSVLRRI